MFQPFICRLVKKQSKYVHGFVQDCDSYIADAMELLQSCDEPLMYIIP